MSRETGDTITGTVRQPTEALCFGLSVQEEYAALHGDPEAWAEYLDEAESSHVIDGID